MAEPVLKQHIDIDPAICGGQPRIAGTRIRVWDIHIFRELHGMSPDEIVEDFPQLTLADVYSALSYYWDHRDEIETQARANQNRVEDMQTKHPSRLLQKLAERDAQ